MKITLGKSGVADVRAAVPGRIEAIKGSTKTEGQLLSFKVGPTSQQFTVSQVRKQRRLYWMLSQKTENKQAIRRRYLHGREVKC